MLDVPCTAYFLVYLRHYDILQNFEDFDATGQSILKIIDTVVGISHPLVSQTKE